MSKYLHYNDRPLRIKEKIDEVFNNLNPVESTWYQNGLNDLYKVFHLKESYLYSI